MDKKTKLKTVHAVTRREAIADGLLIDVTPFAMKEASDRPIDITDAVWAKCIDVFPNETWLNENRRIWEVVAMMRNSIKRSPDENPLCFLVLVQDSPSSFYRLTLKAVCKSDGSGNSAITVMLPDEN